jgi:hypothetical protein
MSSARRGVAILAVVTGAFACKEIAGQAAQSFVVGDQFVIVNNGYSWNKVTWVVVRNWPRSSTADERFHDKRLTLEFGVPDDRLIRLPDGRRVSPAREPHVYFFDGDKLTSFAIGMTEDDWIGSKFNTMASYDDVLAWFRKFAVEAGSPQRTSTAINNVAPGIVCW